MVLTDFLSLFTQGNMILFLIIFFVFIILAYKVFKFVIRIVIVGAIGAVFPFFANHYLGMGIAITFQNVLEFALLAIASYLVYHIVYTILKVLSAFFSLFRKKKKEKIIIREREKAGRS